MDEENEWRCAGCGVLSPDRVRQCDCPTGVVCMGFGPTQKSAWKREPYFAPIDEKWLKSQIDKLRAEASRGPVPGIAVFALTDPIMDRLAHSAGNAGSPPQLLEAYPPPWYSTADGIKDSRGVWICQASPEMRTGLVELANYAARIRAMGGSDA